MSAVGNRYTTVRLHSLPRCGRRGRSGGFGALGAASFTPEGLEQELAWIDEHVEGKPYGVDILAPVTYECFIADQILVAQVPIAEAEADQRLAGELGSLTPARSPSKVDSV